MRKYEILSLEDFLTIFEVVPEKYKNNEVELEKIDIPEELLDFSYRPDWVSQDILVGNRGEAIAYLYLSQRHQQPVQLVSHIDSSVGYDIEVLDEFSLPIGYEVKTTGNADHYIVHITANELQKSHELKDRYNIFIINLADRKGFIINNPLKNLDIPYFDLVKTCDSIHYEIRPTSFSMEIREMMRLTDIIDLSLYIDYLVSISD